MTDDSMTDRMKAQIKLIVRVQFLKLAEEIAFI